MTSHITGNKISTYDAGLNLFLNGVNYFIDTSPLILVFCTTLDDAETFQDVYYVIDTSTLNT